MKLLLASVLCIGLLPYVQAQNCSLPAPLATASSITSFSYQLRWQKIDGAAYYEVKYKLSGTGPYLNSINTGLDTSITLSGLQSNTRYANQVIAYCDNDKKGSVYALSVKTLLCSPPVVNEVTVQPDTSVLITWDGNPSGYNAIRYRLAGSETWSQVNTDSVQSATLYDLDYGSNYQFQVKSCESSDSTDWSVIQTFTVVVHYKPYIVFLLTDDDSYKNYALDGGFSFFNPPAINRIANEGANFKSNYVTMSACNPSRCSFLTGLMPNHTGVLGNRDHLEDSIPNIGSILQANGYYTGFIGKYPDIEDVSPRAAWNYWMAFIAGSGLHEDANYNINGTTKEIDGFNDYTLMDTALRIIKTQAHRNPFMLVVSFSGVHYPYLTPPDMDGIYDSEEVNVPENFHYYTQNYVSKLYDGTEYHDTASCVTDDRNKLEMLNGIDSSVSRLFALLDSLNITDSTMIIYTTDNGYMQGEHLLHGKIVAQEQSMRIPLFIRYKDWFTPHTEITSPLTLNIDLAPTMLDAAGINNTYHMDGHSLRPYADGTADRDLLYFEAPNHSNFRAIRSKSYKYIWYNCDSANTEEFYDLTVDSNEDSNLINKASYQALIAAYRIKLDSMKNFWGDTINPVASYDCYLSNILYSRDADDETAGQKPILILYPNPASDEIKLYWEDEGNENNTITILNLAGEKVYAATLQEKDKEHLLSIPVNSLANGMYEAVIEDGKRMLAQKFIVSH